MSDTARPATGNTAAGSREVDVDWRAIGARLRNWGRWGHDDQLGTLNFITGQATAAATRLVEEGTVISMSIPFDAYGPHGASGFRRNLIHLMSLDGGDEDLYRNLGDWGGPTERALQQRQASSPLRFADDFVMMPLQVGTQWDALSHAYYDGQLYNGYSAQSITSFGATRNSIDHVARKGVVGRGILADVAGAHGVERLEPGYSIEPEELQSVLEKAGVEPHSGDVLLVRTGAWEDFARTRDSAALYGPSPGLGWRCAEWLHKHEFAAVAADNLAVDVSPSGIPNVNLPLHLIGLRDMGLSLGELWNLGDVAQECHRRGRFEFLLLAQPLAFVGAVGSPLNPMAVF